MFEKMLEDLAQSKCVLIGLGEEFQVKNIEDEERYIQFYKKLREALGNKDYYILTQTEDDLIFRSGFDKKCDITLGITADRDTLIQRIISRDKISRSDAEKRLKNQHPKEFFIENCTYTIENTLGLDELEKAVASVINEIKEL